jgi:hypothetical protein
MKKRIPVFSVFVIIFSLLLVAQVSAVVHFSRLSSVYNVGDIAEVSMSIDPVEAKSIAVNLVCGAVSELKFFHPLVQEAQVVFPLPLTASQLGECYLVAEYAGGSYQSQTFKISKELDVRLDNNYFSVKPGDTIYITGTASKLNGKSINGEIRATIPVFNTVQTPVEETENNSEEENAEIPVEETEVDVEETAVENTGAGTFYGNVVDGEFSINFTLSEDTPTGEYFINIIVTESTGDADASDGRAEASLSVQQILKKVDIVLSDQNFDPGTVFSFKPLLRDQADMAINDEVAVIIRDSKGNRAFEKIVQSEETVDYQIPTNISADYYEVEASHGNISMIKKFYINEKALVSFELRNNTVIVTNIGNVRYNRDIQIELNGKPFVKKVDLDVGESQEFRLTGPAGDYDVKIGDGETEVVANSVPLTGHTIDVEELENKGSGLGVSSTFVWVFVIVILGIGVFFFFKNLMKKKSFAYPLPKLSNLRIRKTPKVVRLDAQGRIVRENDGMKKPEKIQKAPLVPPSQAEQVLVLKGQRNPAVVIAIKIKNKISDTAKQSLESAIEHVYDKRGAVYEQGDYIFIMLSPLMTRTYKNEIEAAKIAEKIVLGLKEHNKKFKDKIEFGIGISTGNVINKIEDKRFKFTALGNFITSAKRLADSSNEQIFVTKEACEKGIHELHFEKKKVAGGEVYEIIKVADREANEKFIRKFLERLEK